MSENIEQKCLAKGVKLTDQRKIIAKKYVNSSIEAILLEKIHNSNVVIMGVEAEKYHQPLFL